MKKFVLVTILASLLFQGCSTNYEGKSAEEWHLKYVQAQARYEMTQTAYDDLLKNSKHEEQVMEFQKQCTEQRDEQYKKINDSVKSCTTQKCVDNIANGSLSSITPGKDYVEKCIEAKLNQISNF